MSALESINQLKMQMSKSIIGQDDLLARLVLVLLADGNLLLEGLPSLAKTRVRARNRTNLFWTKPKSISDAYSVRLSPSLCSP